MKMKIKKEEVITVRVITKGVGAIYSKENQVSEVDV